MAPSTIGTLAAKAASMFEVANRAPAAGGMPYVRLHEGSPEWVHDLVRAAHGTESDGSPEFLPDDYRYRWAGDACSTIAEAGESEDMGDLEHEFAEACVDDYTSDRCAWLGSHTYRPEYCDEAASELGVEGRGGVLDLIALGQAWEAREVFGLVLAFLTEHAAEEEACAC